MCGVRGLQGDGPSEAPGHATGGPGAHEHSRGHCSGVWHHSGHGPGQASPHDCLGLDQPLLLLLPQVLPDLA